MDYSSGSAVGVLAAVLMLTACTSNGPSTGPANADVQPTVGADARLIGPRSFLYVGEYLVDAVAVFPLDARGNAPPIATISGSKTGMTGPVSVALDRSGRIYVLQRSQANSTPSITVYPPGANGNVSPAATIAAGKALTLPQSMTVDAAGTIYVGNFPSGATPASIVVFAPGANGNATPEATISGPNTRVQTPTGLALDRAGNLYVANGPGANVLVFAPGANGNVAPAAVLEGSATGLETVTAVALDGAGKMYVGSEGFSGDMQTGHFVEHVGIFRASAHGNVPPLAQIGGTDLNRGTVTSVAVTVPPPFEWSGTLYVGQNTEGSILAYAGSSILPCGRRRFCRDENLRPSWELSPIVVPPTPPQPVATSVAIYYQAYSHFGPPVT